ncbi:MAG: class I SAM-dependent methyltransferase [Candidatus Erginobacter occultus]|nr:class I SAM-dependent methyltransferase [Candidatus Erginobacter occultus]
MLNNYFREIKSFDRVLSICCGDGPHELTMLESGKVGFLHAFDISEGALRQARARFAKAGISEDRYKLEVKDANQFDIEGSYDLVVSAGAAHHIEALERVFSRVASLIAPSGYFALLEYIGPSRFQWTERQIKLLNDILAALPEEYLSKKRRPPLGRPSVKALMKKDPSEAVRSADIIPLMGEYFRTIYRSDYHGTLIHPLYPFLNHALADRNRIDFDAILRLILTFEDLAIRTGVLEPDFTFIICQAK